LALWGIEELRRLESLGPLAGEVTLDGRVLAFSLLVSLGTGLAFGLAPALQVASLEVNATLKEGVRSVGRSRTRVRSTLIVLEVALALVLLTEAGLLLKSFWLLWSTPTGFEPENALAIDLSLPDAKYPDGDRRARFLHELFPRIEALPGVEAAG